MKKLEWNDLRCFLTLFNFIAVLLFGTNFAWVGIAVSLLGICKDVFVDKKWNGLIMHLSNVLAGLYFILI